MYFRFHRAKQILPGVRLNMAKTGPSLSVGPVGARVNVSSQGIRATGSVPGTGLSLIERRSWGSMGKVQPASGAPTFGMILAALIALPIGLVAVGMGSLILWVLVTGG